MKTIIVGGGIMGLTTAWGLARLGHEIELFEQGPLPNPLASSMDEHRLIRQVYGVQSGYARMIDEAYAAWDLLWSDLGQKHYAATGTLALTGNGEDWAERSAATMAALGRPMTELTIAELTRRFPLLDARGVERAFWSAGGGELFAQDIVAALVRHLGTVPRVRLHAHTPVGAVDLDKARVTTAAGAVYGADTVVVAAGAWTTRLLPDLGPRLAPSRQVVIYFDLPAGQRAAWEKAPMIIEKTGDLGLYLVPPRDGRGLKVGDHEFSRQGDPSAPRDATVEEMQPLLGRCASLLHGFDRWRIERLKVCFYTVTDDERFVVEKAGAHGWILSACSGHGFKFAAVMGLELAGAIVAGRAAAEHARWAAGWVGDSGD
jgi:glycine/D-amino acid oxidase-like deaminating enzyme